MYISFSTLLLISPQNNAWIFISSVSGYKRRLSGLWRRYAIYLVPQLLKPAMQFSISFPAALCGTDNIQTSANKPLKSVTYFLGLQMKLDPRTNTKPLRSKLTCKTSQKKDKNWDSELVSSSVKDSTCYSCHVCLHSSACRRCRVHADRRGRPAALIPDPRPNGPAAARPLAVLQPQFGPRTSSSPAGWAL